LEYNKLINLAPQKMVISEVRGGFNKLYVSHSTSGDYDALGRIFWVQEDGSALPPTTYKLDPFSNSASLGGLLANKSYTVTGAFYDSFSNDATLDAKVLIEVSDPYTVVTQSGTSITGITFETLDVDIGVTIPNLNFALVGACDVLIVEYREGTAAWDRIYSGPMSSSVVIPAPKLGSLEFRVKGAFYNGVGVIEEGSNYVVWPNIVDVGLNFSNPSTPSTPTAKIAKINDSFERYDVKLTWNWVKGTGAGLRGFVVEYTSTADYAINGFDKAKTLAVGNTLSTIITNFPFNIPHKIRIVSMSYGEVNYRANSGILDLTITSSSVLDNSFTKETLIDINYNGITAYRNGPLARIVTFKLDANTGNAGFGTPIFGKHPIQIDGTTGVLSVDGGVITKKINAASFVLTNFTGTDNPALYTEGKTYASGVSGIWTGYDNTSGIYKFDLGNSAKYIRWDGSKLLISGQVVIGTVNGDIPLEDTIAKRFVYVYKSSATQESPTGNAYPPAGWSTIPVAPANSNENVWVSQGLLNDVTGVLQTGYSWSASIRFSGINGVNGINGANGANGVPGYNNATVFLYKRSASTPALPTTNSIYTFTTKTLTGFDNGWTIGVPAGTDPVYIIAATASSASSSDTIASNEWTSPTILASDGADGSDGVNTAAIFLYRRSTVVPTKPSVSTTYTFASGVLTGANNAWVQGIPSGTDPLYVTTATAVSTSSTDVIAATEWATPVVLAQNGDVGSRGAGTFTIATSTGAWSDTTAASAVPGYPVQDDVVTIYKATDFSIANTKRFNGSSWVTPGLMVHGDMIASGSVLGDRFVAGTEIKAPVINGGTVQMIGSTIMRVTSSTPFGPHSLIEWTGPRLVDELGNPSWNSLLKSNAITYLTATGDAYFGGSLSAGVLKSGVTNSLKTEYVLNTYPVEVGPFATNGGSKTVVVSYSLAASSSTSTAPGTLTQPSVSWTLERSIGGAAFTVLTSGTFSGSTTSRSNPETGQYDVTEFVDGSLTFPDTSAATGDFIYRVKITAYTRYHVTSSVQAQTLTLISTEG